MSSNEFIISKLRPFCFPISAPSTATVNVKKRQNRWHAIGLMRIGYGSVKTEPKKFIFQFRQRPHRQIFRIGTVRCMRRHGPVSTTPTTILVAVIKANHNRKTNLKGKTNPNPDLQKTCKKKLKEKCKKIIAHRGFEPVTLDSISTIRTLYHSAKGASQLVTRSTRHSPKSCDELTGG